MMKWVGSPDDPDYVPVPLNSWNIHTVPQIGALLVFEAADELEAVKFMRNWHTERATAVVARQRLLFDIDM